MRGNVFSDVGQVANINNDDLSCMPCFHFEFCEVMGCMESNAVCMEARLTTLLRCYSMHAFGSGLSYVMAFMVGVTPALLLVTIIRDVGEQLVSLLFLEFVPHDGWFLDGLLQVSIPRHAVHVR